MRFGPDASCGVDGYVREDKDGLQATLIVARVPRQPRSGRWKGTGRFAMSPLDANDSERASLRGAEALRPMQVTFQRHKKYLE
jgi:hypothetical protein